MRFIILISLITTIAACATPQVQQERPAGPLPPTARPVYNLGGYSAGFKDGYIDGCETAKKTRYAAKNQQRFSTDSQYRSGWNDGFSLCSPKP
jgi:hypothetical protein